MLNTGVFKPTILKPMMLKPLLLVTILAWLPLTPMANAESIELLPSISLQIGEQDRRGNYWDGYDWRDQGRNLGERNRNGHYWDGRRWQDRGWWKKNYYYREGRYWKYDKHGNKHGQKHHNKKGRGHRHDD